MKRAKPKPKAAKPYSIQDGVTQSLLSSWVHCRQNARYYLDGWRQPGTKEALAFGGLWHHILETLYEGIRTGRIKRAIDLCDTRQEALGIVFDECIASWRAKIRGWTSPIESQLAETCIAKATAIFPGYCEKWVKDFKPSIWRELEGVFDVTWKGYRLRGRIDGVRVIKGKLWILETKTMGQIDKALDEVLGFDFQSEFYITAAEIAIGKPVEGVLYNVIRRPSHKLLEAKILKSGPRPAETMPAFVDRLRAAVEKEPDHFFKRFELTFSKKERKRFLSELEAKLAEFTAWVGGDVANYRDERSCRGRWTCDVLGACSSGSMAGFVQDGRLFEELED